MSAIAIAAWQALVAACQAAGECYHSNGNCDCKEDHILHPSGFSDPEQWFIINSYYMLLQWVEDGGWQRLPNCVWRCSDLNEETAIDRTIS